MESNKSGLQQLAELKTALTASTARLRSYNDAIARSRRAPSKPPPSPDSPWGAAVGKLAHRNAPDGQPG